MKKGTLWTRDEYIVVLNLYYKLPFGKLNRGVHLKKSFLRKRSIDCQ
jgi:hypothetical protein